MDLALTVEFVSMNDPIKQLEILKNLYKQLPKLDSFKTDLVGSDQNKLLFFIQGLWSYLDLSNRFKFEMALNKLKTRQEVVVIRIFLMKT